MSCNESILFKNNNSIEFEKENDFRGVLNCSLNADGFESKCIVDLIHDSIVRVRIDCNTTTPLENTHSIVPLLDEKLGTNRNQVQTIFSPPNKSEFRFENKILNIETESLKIEIDCENFLSIKWYINVFLYIY